MQRTGVGEEEIQTLRGEFVSWSDGSLGCPRPGESYIQVQTPGYRVVLAAGGKAYDSRATEAGHFTLREVGGHRVLLRRSSSKGWS